MYIAAFSKMNTPVAAINAITRPSSSQTHDLLVHEIVYRESGSLGLVIDPVCVTFETLPGKLQSFWCGMVRTGLGKV